MTLEAELGRMPALMGVLNVTPDSFSDGGRFLDPSAAVAHAQRLRREGAELVDIGGESTRPGAAPVALDEELRRVMPVVEGASDGGIPVSIDTSKAEVARRSVAAGAQLVNDVTAMRGDPQMADVVAASGVRVCLMHMLGRPATMQDQPRYDDVVDEVKGFLEQRLAVAVEAGIPEERVWLDPGIGFGKLTEHNLALLARLDEIVAIGRPVLVGVSRKRFIGSITGHRSPADRLAGSLAAALVAARKGAAMLRVHDVAETRDALLVAAATVDRER